MSLAMDGQDLLGAARGLCLVRLVKHAPGVVELPFVERYFAADLRPDLLPFARALQRYCGIDADAVIAAAEELLEATPEYLAPENLNLQLGLLSRRPLPEYPFVTDRGVDLVGLVRPFLDVSCGALHAAIRLRMQSTNESDHEEFWPVASRFLSAAWGRDEIANALALTSVFDAVSNVLFYNWDIERRASDQVLLAQSTKVVAELRRLRFPAPCR